VGEEEEWDEGGEGWEEEINEGRKGEEEEEERGKSHTNLCQIAKDN